MERLAASLPAEQAQALMNQQEGQEGDRQGQAWQQQDTEAFLSQLGEVRHMLQVEARGSPRPIGIE